MTQILAKQAEGASLEWRGVGFCDSTISFTTEQGRGTGAQGPVPPPLLIGPLPAGLVAAAHIGFG